MHKRNVWRVTSFAGIILLTGVCFAQEIVATPKEPTGVYRIGEAIEWKIEIKQSTTAPATKPATVPINHVHYILKKDAMKVMAEGDLDLTAGSGTIQTAMDEPGTVLAVLTANVAGKELKGLAGAAVEPDKIVPSAARPDDFDVFWQKKIDQLNAIPPNPRLEPADGEKPGIGYFKLELDNINGTHVWGQLAKPQKEGKYPALLIVQYAGVYGLPKTNVTVRAQQGWIALNIMAHDLPFDQPEAFYKQAAATTLKDYIYQGHDDREKSYFLRMYLGDYRAAEYLASRPDWDGKTLVVMGTSQGGQQTFVTAALCPKITTMMANVPSGCDATGPLVGRASGFPYWYASSRGKPDEKQIMETSRYFDVVNLASRIKCPALMSTGLIDETCPTAGVFAAFNKIQGKKRALVMVNSDHHGTHNAQAAFYTESEKWLKALAKGEAAPLP